jgi:hypothetical protein
MLEDIRTKASEQPLSTLVEVQQFDTLKTQDLESYKPRCNPWKVPELVLEVLSDFDKNIDSIIFNKLLEKRAKELEQKIGQLPFWEAFEVLWRDVCQHWERLCAELKDGSIALSSMKDIFSMFSKSRGMYNHAEIQKELKKIEGSDDQEWVEQRMEEFFSYNEVKQYMEAAGLILKLREANGMTEGFDEILQIVTQVRN